MSVYKPRYTDVLGEQWPELEKCLIRHRALQSYLLLYHGEELQSDLLEMAQIQFDWDEFHQARLKKLENAKDTLGSRRKSALRYLIERSVLTAQEARCIPKFIGQRNHIAHELEKLNVDVSPNRSAQDLKQFGQKIPEFSHETLKEIKQFRTMVRTRGCENLPIIPVGMRGLAFQPIERVLTDDIDALERRIRRLVRQRRDDIRSLNAEMDLSGTELTGTLAPSWIENKDNRGRLTQRGVEICYRLFDLDKSRMAVAHLMGLKLGSVQARYKKWLALGGKGRHRSEIPVSRYSEKVDSD